MTITITTSAAIVISIALLFGGASIGLLIAGILAAAKRGDDMMATRNQDWKEEA